MTAPLLQLSNVTKSFGAVRALKGVSFDLQPGEVHALLGENGAGKSTLIKIITGAHQPDGGTIAIDGQYVRHLTPAAAHRLGIACIYQQPAPASSSWTSPPPPSPSRSSTFSSAWCAISGGAASASSTSPTVLRRSSP